MFGVNAAKEMYPWPSSHTGVLETVLLAATYCVVVEVLKSL